MTKPFASFVEYNGDEYTLIRSTCRNIDPFDLMGVEPNEVSTAGNTIARYAVQNDKFFLKDIRFMHSVSKDELRSMPSVNGAKAVGEYYDEADSVTDWVHYKDVYLFLPISGYVTIGRNLASHYKWTRLPPCPRDYEIVFRLLVTDGHIDSVEDLSARAKAVREADIAIWTEWIALSEQGKDTFDSDFKRKERSALFYEDRCIENPNECNE